ncbi:MAG TPA: PH domain-containing protein [Vicinamibacteria bacterium]|nr:PH domain-containing protein [Vicinamibacteria bacterium]
MARLHALPRSFRLGMGGLAAVSAVALGALSAGKPRFTLLNTAIVIDYPWPRGLAALGCAIALALFALTLARPAPRRALLLAALLPVAVGWHLLLYRLEAAQLGLTSRGALGSTALSWREVQSVSLGAGAVVVEGESGSIRIDTTDFSAEQRGALERAVARRVRESGSGSIVTVPD